MAKPITCSHCKAVNSHYSFQCPTIRKPIKKGKLGTPIGHYTMVKRKAIAPISDKQKKRLAEYRVVRDDYMANHKWCEAKLNGCTSIATDLHHKAGKVGALLTDSRYFCALCRSCHTWVGENHSKAKELGLVVDRLDK